MIGATENAMLARLKAAADADVLGYAWRLLETYPDDWDAWFKERKGALNTPAAWVTFAGFTGMDRLDSGGYRARATFGVTVAARNLRNETAARHGHEVADGQPPEPGSYQLAMDAIALLGGSDLGLDIDPLEPTRMAPVPVATLFGVRNLSMYAILFETVLPIAQLLPEADTSAPFELFHANWDVRPFGGIDADPDEPGVQLPDDDHADATDDVELPQ